MILATHPRAKVWCLLFFGMHQILELARWRWWWCGRPYEKNNTFIFSVFADIIGCGGMCFVVLLVQPWWNVPDSMHFNLIQWKCGLTPNHLLFYSTPFNFSIYKRIIFRHRPQSITCIDKCLVHCQLRNGLVQKREDESMNIGPGAADSARKNCQMTHCIARTKTLFSGATLALISTASCLIGEVNKI